MFMTSSSENASRKLHVLLLLFNFLRLSLNRPLYTGIYFHFGFDGLRLSRRGSVPFGICPP